MADHLHKLIYEVKGTVNWLSSARIASQGNHSRPGALRLTRLVDTFYIQCNFDGLKTKSKKLKVDTNSIMGAKLMARDGALTVLIPVTGGSIRFVLQRGIESEIEQFIHHLNEIKARVMEKAVSYNPKVAEYAGPILRVQTLYGSKEASVVPTLVLRGPGLQKAAYKSPLKTNDSKEPLSQALNKTSQENKSVTKLATQQGNRQHTPNKTPPENKGPSLRTQQGNRQHTPNKTLQSLRTQEGNHHHTPSKTPQENKGRWLRTQQGNRQNTPNKLTPKNISAHEASAYLRAQSYGENPQNKTHASIPKILPHPRNIQKQKNRPASERMDTQRGTQTQDDLEKENINVFIDSPEKMRSPEKLSQLWSTFGTPRKRTPLKENETSPQFTRPSNTKNFYGSSGTSLQCKRSVKRPPRKSVFEVPSSSSPSQTPRTSQFASTAARDKLNKLTNNQSRQTTFLSSYFNDSSEVTSQGFTNLGNTCYMNAVLQSILGLVPFVQELENTELLNLLHHSSLYHCMYNLFRCKNEDGSSVAKKNALRRLKRSLNSNEMTKRFSGHQQNDAHEFMNICLDQIKEEVQNALSEESDDAAAKFCPVVRNFEGSLRKYIRCKGCEDVVTKDELFNHLSLNIPHSRSSVELSLTRLLGRFFQSEELERSCEKCNCGIAVQYLKIRTLPRVIILHLLRSEFDQHSGTQEKNSNRIRVDRFLEIGSFCSSDNSGPLQFVPKKTSPTKSRFIVDNETPFSDDDFVVTKPRRRLNMEATHDAPSDKDEKGTGSSENPRKYPDWVYSQSKRPTLSVYSDSSDDDNDMKKAKLASLREIRLNLDEEEQIRRAKFASLQERQPHASSSEEIEPECDSEEQRGRIEDTGNTLQENGTHCSGEQIASKNDRSQGELAHSNENRRVKQARSLQEENIGRCDEWEVSPTMGTNHQEIQKQDEQAEFLKINSSRDKQGMFSEEEIRDKRTASFQEKQTDSGCEEVNSFQRTRPDNEEEQLRQAIIASQQTKQEEDLKSNFRSCGDVSDIELMEIADSLDEETYAESDSAGVSAEGINRNKNTENVNTENSEGMDDVENCPPNMLNGSRKRPSLDSNVSELHVAQENTNGYFKLNGGARNSMDTPSKRRKVENGHTDKAPETDIVSSHADEYAQLKQALEISQKEHDKSQSTREAIEQSQMEEAIRMSLEDGGVNVASEEMVIEEPAQEIPPEMKRAEEEQEPSEDFSYGLVSVVSHVGSSTSVGHYISDVYDVKTNQWTRYDDITAKKIAEYVVRYDKLSDGYIYFYMHRKCINLLKQNSSNS